MRKQPDRELSRRRVTGMGVGIAEKSGNADGVKAPTAVERRRANIYYMQR